MEDIVARTNIQIPRSHKEEYRPCWYLVLYFSVNIFISIISILAELTLHMRTAPLSIIIVVACSAVLLVPLIGHPIYNMSKEKYY